MGNKEILKKIQDSTIKEYNKYREMVCKLPGNEIFNMAGEIYAYECIVSYFAGIEVDIDYDTNTAEMLIELYDEDVPNDILSALVNMYYNTNEIDISYWGGVEELISILHKEEFN